MTFQRARDIWPLKKLIIDQIDHGSEFCAHRIDKYGLWDNEFKRHNEKLGISEYLQYRLHKTNKKI